MFFFNLALFSYILGGTPGSLLLMYSTWHRIDQAFRPSTLAAHTTHFKTFLAYLVFMKLPIQISVHNVLTFLEYLYCRQISPAVLRNYVSSIRSMGTKFLLDVSPLSHFTIDRYIRSVSINSQFAPSPRGIFYIKTLYHISLFCDLLQDPPPPLQSYFSGRLFRFS